MQSLTRNQSAGIVQARIEHLKSLRVQALAGQFLAGPLLAFVAWDFGDHRRVTFDEWRERFAIITYPLSDNDRVANLYSDYFDGVEGITRTEMSQLGTAGRSFTSEDTLVPIGQDTENTSLYIQTSES